jgi:hypothetical protein
MKRSKTKGTSQMTGPEDQSITGLIRRGLSSAGGTGAAGECPEPEVLAAYYDRALEPEEAARAEAHFSDCASCRSQLAALVRSDVTERKPRGFAWLWGWRLLVPAAALGVTVLAVWIAVRTPLHPPQQVAEVKAIPTVTPKTAENPPPPPPPTGSAAQSPAATRATEQRKSANAGGGKLGRQSRAAGGEERREGLAADKTAPQSPGAPAEETKKEAQMAQADTSKEAAPGKPSAPPSGAPSPSAPVSPRPAGAFANKTYSGGAVRGETKREKAFAAVSGPREVRIPSPDPLVVWHVVRDGMLERSEDGGAAWRVQIQKPAAALLAGSAPSAKVCWVVGRAGIVLRTTDGEHWMKASSPAPVDLVDVKAVDGTHATVTAADGRAFATADGGETWQQPAP